MKNKNTWICILFILAGLVIGGLIGQHTSEVDFLWWLSYSQEYGQSANKPLVLDLGIAKVTFALMFKINIASIIGVIISIFIYRKAL